MCVVDFIRAQLIDFRIDAIKNHSMNDTVKVDMGSAEVKERELSDGTLRITEKRGRVTLFVSLPKFYCRRKGMDPINSFDYTYEMLVWTLMEIQSILNHPLDMMKLENIEWGVNITGLDPKRIVRALVSHRNQPFEIVLGKYKSLGAKRVMSRLHIKIYEKGTVTRVELKARKMDAISVLLQPSKINTRESLIMPLSAFLDKKSFDHLRKKLLIELNQITFDEPLTRSSFKSIEDYIYYLETDKLLRSGLLEGTKHEKYNRKRKYEKLKRSAIKKGSFKGDFIKKVEDKWDFLMSSVGGIESSLCDFVPYK